MRSKALNKMFTVSGHDAHHQRDTVEKKPVNSSLMKSLNGILTSLCGKQEVGPAVYLSPWPNLTNRAGAYRLRINE